MTWTDFRQTVNFLADVLSILMFLGLGIIGLKVGRLVRRFGKKRIVERMKKFFEV